MHFYLIHQVKSCYLFSVGNNHVLISQLNIKKETLYLGSGFPKTSIFS